MEWAPRCYPPGRELLEHDVMVFLPFDKLVVCAVGRGGIYFNQPSHARTERSVPVLRPVQQQDGIPEGASGTLVIFFIGLVEYSTGGTTCMLERRRLGGAWRVTAITGKGGVAGSFARGGPA